MSADMASLAFFCFIETLLTLIQTLESHWNYCAVKWMYSSTAQEMSQMLEEVAKKKKNNRIMQNGHPVNTVSGQAVQHDF